MSLYLVRLAETGREAQPGRSKIRHDVVAEIRAQAPEAEIRAEPGRVFVTTPPGQEPGRDLTDVLRAIHGVVSFSPCEHCALEALDEHVVRVATRALAGRTRFRVRTRRVGRHDFTSRAMNAALGARILAALPHAVVDLAAPRTDLDAEIGVEIRGRDCYVFDRVIPGMDRAPPAREHAGLDRDRGTGTSPPAPAFLVDHMLGRLVRWLRLLGHDAIYARDEADSELLRRARREGRVILTRDRALAQTQSARTLFVAAREPMAQLAEVATALGLRLDERRMFTRCSLCNGPVQAVDKEQVRDRLPPAAGALYDELTFCAACDKVYWKGNQYDRILACLAPFLAGTARER